ncbi:MAG: radical SAM family heme chaperone HemW [Deltaproteobacteria bacterium]|nr:radical SAM family heme chaperone HemW [Deltaproteobacteria bacterium]
MFGVYVHIPFCAKKCPFCDFAVTTRKQPAVIESYFAKTIQEIHTCATDWAMHEQIDTIFFGGGTPSLVAPHCIDQILHALQEHFAFSDEIEITLECNPEDVTQDKIQALQNIGVNRFSLGAQHFEDAFLQKLGRIHTAQEVHQAIEVLQQCQVNNWSLDLIFGIPGQTLQNWQQVLQKAVAYAPLHISTYELTIEPGTVFGKQRKKGILPAFPENDMALMFAHSKTFLQSHHYLTYETSNAAKAGYLSKHNMSCWQGDAYWGIGVSAHSRMIDGDTITRIENPHTFSAYMQLQDFRDPKLQAPISAQAFAQECIWTGLRLSQGIPTKQWTQYQQALEADFKEKAQRLFDQGLLCSNQDFIYLAPHAQIYADTIALDLLS